MPGHIVIYDIARDGRILLRTDTRQVGILGVAPGEDTERDLSCLDQSVLSGISDDGRIIVATILGESGGPKGSIYMRRTDGSPPVRLGDGVAFALSPDGKWVSGYYSIDANTRRYVLFPTGAGEERVVSIPQLHGVNIVYGWSRDDESWFEHGHPPGHGMRNYLWDSRTRTLHPIGPEGIADDLPMVSPDRHQILDVGPDGRWWMYPVDGGDARALDQLDEHDRAIGWREDSRSIYVDRHHDVNRMLAVFVLDIESGNKTPWKEIRPARPVDEAFNPVITPDGRTYAYNFRVKTSELYVASGLH